MRILGFSTKWDKLQQPQFTTFRFARRDRDWQVGEVVQIVFKPRSKNREILGSAKIVSKEPRAMAWHGDKTGLPKIHNEEAIEDGFRGEDNDFGFNKIAYFYMWEFLFGYYGGERLLNEPMNKLTLAWVEKEMPV